VLVGDIMNIYLNIRFILETMENLKNNDTGDVTLIDFLNAICENINSSFAGLNLLQPFIDETTNIVYIIDQKPLPNRNSFLKLLNENYSDNKTVFSLLNSKNKSSFINKFSVKTELTPEFSTLISVGAQARGKVVGEDATAFSNWNKGLKDRLVPRKIDYYEKTNKDSVDDVNNRFKNAKEEFTSVIKFFIQRTPNKINKYNEKKSSLQSILKSIVSATQQKQATEEANKSSSSSGLGFIPINLSLEMLGLAGMKIFESFDVEQQFLPSNYPESLEFIIKNISHEIDTNGWSTTIESLSIPPEVKPVIVDISSDVKVADPDSGVLGAGGTIGTISNEDTPNADRLRAFLALVNYTEKQNYISEAGDITSETANMGIAILNEISSQLPNLKIEVTSGNDVFHLNRNSRHKEGRGLDFTILPYTPDNGSKVERILQGFAAGSNPNVRYENEYLRGSSGNTGGHFHISWGAGSEYANNLLNAIKLAENKQITTYKI
ncbi:MAG: hypothetical protein KC414_08980, partial [Romboutsia sp.]|nr:hypothetical protein [Romboutsia sp.]